MPGADSPSKWDWGGVVKRVGSSPTGFVVVLIAVVAAVLLVSIGILAGAAATGAESTFNFMALLIPLLGVGLSLVLAVVGTVIVHRMMKGQGSDAAQKETAASPAQDVAGQVTDQAGQVADQVTDQAGQAAQQAQDTTGQETPTRAPRTDQAAVGGTVLSVLKFNDPYGAERAVVALQGLQEQEMITLQDAAVVSWPQGNKKPKTHQLHSTAGAGAGWGAFWGFLFGLIFFVPFLGAAMGAGMGALSGSLADVGIDDDFVKQVREKVTEGTSALFALTSGATTPDRVIDELRQYDFEIISTNLPEEQENQLREAFAQE